MLLLLLLLPKHLSNYSIPEKNGQWTMDNYCRKGRLHATCEGSALKLSGAPRK